MHLLDFFNKRSRKLSIIDWKLAQGAAMCLAILGVKLFPRVLDINALWLVVLAFVLYVKPLYVFYIRK